MTENRLQSIMRERYIHTPQNRDLWEFLDDIMLQVNPDSPRPKVMGVLWTGAPDAGKSTCVRQYMKSYLDNVEGATKTDILYHQIFGRSKLKGELARLCRKTLKIPDVPDNPGKNYPTYLLVEKAAHKLKINGTKLLVIDEMQKLFKLSENERIDILEAWNDILNASHVPIVLVGVEGVDEILNMETYTTYEDKADLKRTFCSRFIPKKLTPWTDPYDTKYVNFLLTINEEICQLNNRANDNGINISSNPFYKNDEIRELILLLTGGLTGKIIDLLKWTSRKIVRYELKEQITAELLKETANELAFEFQGE